MPNSANPYINFDGNCEDALNLYKKVLGTEVTMLMRFGDAPPAAGVMPGTEKKVMHTAFRIGDSTLYASDGHCTSNANLHGVALSVEAKDEAEAERIFNGLADGGTVQLALHKTFFAKSFGIVQDRFGLGFMILVPAPMD